VKQPSTRRHPHKKTSADKNIKKLYNSLTRLKRVSMVRKALNPQSFDDAFTAAMRSLQRAAQTEQGLREKLARRQYLPETIDRVIDKLKTMQLINDQKYAEDYISYRSRTTPLGSRYLKLKLIQKGIEKDLAEEATSTISSEDEFILAQKAAEKKLPRLAKEDRAQQKLKLARFLASRGFRSDVIYKIIGEI
jgi:regulatory protein